MNIGIFLGGLVGLSIVAVLIFFLTRRRSHRDETAGAFPPRDPRRNQGESDTDDR